MKAVILAGGRGTRLAEETGRIPKPMVTVGGVPLLHHLMEYYSHWGVTDFLICGGYKCEVIENYFAELMERRYETTFDLQRGLTHTRPAERPSWNITVVNTGLETQTGGRIRRVAEHLRGEDRFLLTYGDGLSDINLAAEMRQHRQSGRAVTLSAVRPPARFGGLRLDGDVVTAYEEKNPADAGRVNGGFFVVETSVLKLLGSDQDVWESDVLPRLAEEGQLGAYVHDGFWRPVDTINDRKIMEDLHMGGAPWKQLPELNDVPVVDVEGKASVGSCRSCGGDLGVPLIDLGNMPATNSYVPVDADPEDEMTAPLRVRVCTECWLAQTEHTPDPQSLFTGDYAYFSSVSSSWVQHAAQYVDAVSERYRLHPGSFVVELAANDGYLLQHFVNRGIPVLGVEPTASTAAAARAKGVPILQRFFGRDVAAAIRDLHGPADLIVANNVLAHVPDINDFVRGIAHLLSPSGTATFEFPHLVRLLEGCQFDTIYHEHYSYLSLTAVSSVFARAGLTVVDVEQLATHGGSLRVYAQPTACASLPSVEVAAVLQEERVKGLLTRLGYSSFESRAQKVANDFRSFLESARSRGESVVGYGAAAKGTTLINYAGVGTDLLPVVFDAAPSKQGLLLPGCRIPVAAPEQIASHDPDWVTILPWNIAPEIRSQLAKILPSRTKYVVAVPELEVIA